RLLRPTLRLLGAVLAATLVALDVAAHPDALGVERATDDVIAHTGQVLDPAATDQDDGVLLEVVLLPRDVGRYLLATGETHAGDLPESRVGLLRGLGLDCRAHATTLRRPLERRGLALLRDLPTPLAEQLVDGRQNDHSLCTSRASLARNSCPGATWRPQERRHTRRWRLAAAHDKLAPDPSLRARGWQTH